jgi:site-specific DNA-methyltransferase (adenine-specific)
MKIELINDNFQNFKRYGIPKAQLVIADIPYNIGNNFYGSNPMWYNGGIIKTEKANLLRKLHSTQISTLTLLSTSISAIDF